MIRRGENNSFVELCMYDPKNEKVADAGSSFFPLDKASSNTPDR